MFIRSKSDIFKFFLLQAEKSPGDKYLIFQNDKTSTTS